MAAFIDVETEDSLKYQFYPVSASSARLQIRATNDAHIAMTTGPQESDPMIMVYIGCWENTKSGIRKNRTKPEKVQLDTPGILNGAEYRSFLIRWEGGNICVGKEGDDHPFMSWSDPEPFPINYIGVCTGWGATGSWKIEMPPSVKPTDTIAPPPGNPDVTRPAMVWVDAEGGMFPPGAVVGGHDRTGEPLIVARAQHEGSMVPGKLVSSHRCAFVPWGGEEHRKLSYQVLVSEGNTWVQSNGSNIPPNAFPGGESENGEPLFIGRVHHEGSVTTGKVQQSHGVCYISFGGQELSFPDYEILLH